MTTVVGIEKGLAWLSRVNLRLLYLLLAFVFFTGPTNHLLNGSVQNTGDYLSHFVQKSFDLYLYDKKATGRGIVDDFLLGMVDCLGAVCGHVYCPYFKGAYHSGSGFGCMPHSVRFYTGVDFDFWQHGN